MAATEHPEGGAAREALAALTAAALLLPGLVLAPGPARAQAASEEGVAAQFSRYQEGPRPLPGLPNTLRPLVAESGMLRSASPLAGGGSLQLLYTQDTWSGATPVSTAPAVALGNRPALGPGAGGLVVVGASPMINGRVMLGADRQPVQQDGSTGRWVAAPGLVHTLSSASPETRQQLELRRAWPQGEGAWTLGGGVSVERDYHSRFVSLGRRLGFDQGQRTLSLTLSRTRSDIRAALDHDAAPYITKTAYLDQIEAVGGQQVLRARRDDVSLSAGLVQLLGPSALLELRLGHTRSAGYLGVPYKLTSVVFVPPEASAAGPGQPVAGQLQALMEQRPDHRRQWTAGAKLITHLTPLDAALHLGYGHARDDWGIRSHRLEAEWFQPVADGWMAAPFVRYYTQTAARFHVPYLVSAQAFRRVDIGPDGQPLITPFDPALLPAHFASDHRLAGFGTLGWGLSLTRTLGSGLQLTLGLEQARHAAALQAGGRASGEGAYADFRYRVWHAGLSLDFGAPAAGAGARMGGDAKADPHAHHGMDAGHGLPLQPPAPAGLWLAHGAPGPGQWMLGYRQSNQRDGGALLRGSTRVPEADWATAACGPQPCATRPVAMQMRMHMLELMLGLSERFSLMLMPQWMGMAMDSRLVPGAAPAETVVHTGRHESGGIGDTVLQASWRLGPLAQVDSAPAWHLGLGLSLPTGDTGQRHRRSHQQAGALMDPGMQLGSGTWDLLPALDWRMANGPWRWGVQTSAVLRLQSRPSQGYRLGHEASVQTWLARRLTPMWSGSLRLGHRVQGALHGAVIGGDGSAPAQAANQGGRHTELGLGLDFEGAGTAERPAGLALEWLLPLHSRVNGHQLARHSGLVLSWSHHF